MSDPRRSTLDRIAGALAASPPPRVAKTPLPAVAPLAADDQATLIERFTAQLEKLSATWDVAQNPVTARLKLVAWLQDQGVERILAWSADQLPVEGISEALDGLGIAALSPQIGPGPNRRLILADIEPVEIGVTGADAAIAASGALVLSDGPGRPRVVSMLPRRHVALLPVSRLYATVESWLAAQRRHRGAAAITRPANVVFIAGPSRTADIELTLALGVHGPRQLHVLLVSGI